MSSFPIFAPLIIFWLIVIVKTPSADVREMKRKDIHAYFLTYKKV
jgi:hypothetical protein